MASGDNGNLVQEFEEAFQRSVSALTEEDDLNEKDQESVHKNIEEKVSHFTDLARQLETFFLQKRFMIYNHKPEMILKEDTAELKSELVRKDELIRKHYEKLGQWKDMLADVNQVQPSTSQPAGARPQGTPPQGQERQAQAGLPGPNGPTLPGPGGQTPHGGFVPGNNYSRMPGQQQSMYGQQTLQGPLAYLERTTSNIGGPGGMGGGGPMGMMNR